MFTLREVIEKIKDVVKDLDGLAFLAIIGSIASRGFSIHDVDLAVKVLEGWDKLDVICKLVLRLSEALKVPEDRIDVIDLDKADLEIKARTLREGVVIVDRGYLNELRREVESNYFEHRNYLKLSIREWIQGSDPSSIDLTIIKRRLDFIKEEVEFLENNVFTRSFEEVISSPIFKRVLERSFQLIVEAMIDVCRHISSAKGWLREYTAREAIRQCGIHGVIGERLCEELLKMMVLRNIIVHRYLDIDYQELYGQTKRLIALAREFEKNIIEYLRRETHNQSF